jgi:hypothetical protein
VTFGAAKSSPLIGENHSPIPVGPARENAR